MVRPGSATSAVIAFWLAALSSAAADALQYTRWGSTDMPAADVRAHAANGTTRLVAGPAALGPRGQCQEISAFADRLKLG